MQLSEIQERRREKYGYILLECLDSNLTDGTLTRLNIDNGRSYLEVKSKQQKKLGNNSMDESEVYNTKPLFDTESEVQKTYESNF